MPTSDAGVRDDLTVLQTATDVLEETIVDRRATFQEAERILRQMLAVADTKGVVVAAEDRSHLNHLQELRNKIKVDPDLASIYAHVVGSSVPRTRWS